jgi:murein DD-endopeptidase MepM/ murein hydrolase activator NlpD
MFDIRKSSIAIMIAAFALIARVSVAVPMHNHDRLNENLLMVAQTKADFIKEEKVDKASFFGVTTPSLSRKGAVKTYSLKIARKLRSSDWGVIRQVNLASLAKGKKCLLRPVMGRISSSFGRRWHPKRRVRHFHTGIDIVARRGTPILAALAGKVEFAGWKRGYGLVTVVNHGNGLETVYAHCSKLLVKKGQMVNTAQRIAKVGNTGVTTGAHLHFEVKRDGNVRNPFRYMSN